MVRRPATPDAAAPAPRGCAPSLQSVALALVIIKATPSGITPRNYVLQFRAHLKHGQQAFTGTERNHYLDLVAYWQCQYDAAEQKCRELGQKVASLERSVHCLGHLANDDSDHAMEGAPKRKRGAASTAKVQRKPKAQAAKPPSAEEALEEDLELFDTLGKQGALVAQHYWTAHRLLKRPDADADAICGSVVGVASALCHIFPIIAKSHERLATRTVSRPSLGHLGKDRSELSCLMSACAKAWMHILIALNRLEEDSPGSRRSGVVIFECVKLVSAALDAIKLAARQAAWVKGTHTASNRESVAARNISHLIVSLIAHLEKDNAIHQKLFDGIAYVLFERVGNRLYFCTFGRERAATIEERITQPPESTDPHEIARQATEAVAIHLEAKALIIILERVMGVAPLHSNEQATKKAKETLARTISMKNSKYTKIKLSSIAQDRLQRTLITCAFGNDVDDRFVNILTKPVDMGDPPPVPKVRDEDVPEWFQSQVWNLVGWEILEKDDAWVN